MKPAKLQDERITAQRMKTNSEALLILQICLIAAIFIQFFILRAPFAQVAAELVCLLGVELYASVRNAMAGANQFAEQGAKQSVPRLLLSSAATGGLCALFFVVLTGEAAPWTHLLLFAAVGGMQLVLRALTQRRLRKMDDVLADDAPADDETQ